MHVSGQRACFHKAHQTALFHVHKKMASGIVRSAIASALDDADFDIDTDKARLTKELAADLLDAIIKTDDNIECFDRFVEVLVSNFKEIIQKDHRKTKERAWMEFHQLHIGKPWLIWTNFLCTMGLQQRACTGESWRAYIAWSKFYSSLFFQLFSQIISTTSSSPTSCYYYKQMPGHHAQRVIHYPFYLMMKLMLYDMLPAMSLLCS